MKLVDALIELKSKGITELVGLSNVTDIDEYINHARHNDELVEKYAPISTSWQYSLDHADDNFIIEINGHYIIATHEDGFDMETYGDYESEIEMREAFHFWRLKKEAYEIADEMLAKRPNELARDEWFLIAHAELKAERTRSAIAFAKEFKTAIEHYYL